MKLNLNSKKEEVKKETKQEEQHKISITIDDVTLFDGLVNVRFDKNNKPFFFVSNMEIRGNLFIR